MTILSVLLLAVAAVLPQDPLPKDLAGWARRQDEMLDAGKGDDAVAEAKARTEKEPKSAEAQYLLGRILGNKGDIDGAKARFQAALNIDSAYAAAWRGLSLVHLRLRESEAALREARRAWELEESAENRVLLVNALFENGDRAGAYRLLTEALARTPGDNELRTFYAMVLFQDGSRREAEREARQVLASDAGNLGARQVLIRLLEVTGRREETVTEYREFIKRSPKDIRARVNLRRVLMEGRDLAGAVVVTEELLKLDLPAEFRDETVKALKAMKEYLAQPPEAARDPAPPTKETVPDDAELARREADLLRRLESKDVEERRAAMEIVVSLRLTGLPIPIVRRAFDEDEGIREMAVRLMGKYGEPIHLRILEAGIRDASPKVRAAAFRAAGTIGCPAGLLLLFRGLDEKDPVVLGTVVRGIRDLTGKSLVDDPDSAIPAEGVDAIRERAAKWWFEDGTAKQWRRKAAAAVVKEDLPPLAWYLVPWIQDEDPAMRTAALDALIRMGGEEAWRTAPASTREEREALRDRIYARLAEKDKAPPPVPSTPKPEEK